jgi:hypothetical protein
MPYEQAENIKQFIAGELDWATDEQLRTVSRFLLSEAYQRLRSVNPVVRQRAKPATVSEMRPVRG